MQCSTPSCAGCLQIPSACGLGSLLEKTSDHLIFMPSVVWLCHRRNATICACHICITVVCCWLNLGHKASLGLKQAQTRGTHSGRGLASDSDIYIYIQMDFEVWLSLVPSCLQWLHSLHLYFFTCDYGTVRSLCGGTKYWISLSSYVLLLCLIQNNRNRNCQ